MTARYKARFDVSDVDETENEKATEGSPPEPGDKSTIPQIVIEEVDGQKMSTIQAQEKRNAAINELSITSNLALYDEDLKRRPKIAKVLSSIVQYDSGMVPNPKKGKQRRKKSAKLGTIMGVYLPTLQNILGVILFLRLTWIVGTAGVGLAFLLVSICCLCTFLTTISLSAIATNGVVPGKPHTD
jgi:hypothetical protein